MNFSGEVKSVRSNIADGTISITFEVPFEQLDQAEELGHYVGMKGDASSMHIDVTPIQPPLFKEKKKHA